MTDACQTRYCFSVHLFLFVFYLARQMRQREITPFRIYALEIIQFYSIVTRSSRELSMLNASQREITGSPMHSRRWFNSFIIDTRSRHRRSSAFFPRWLKSRFFSVHFFSRQRVCFFTVAARCRFFLGPQKEWIDHLQHIPLSTSTGEVVRAHLHFSNASPVAGEYAATDRQRLPFNIIIFNYSRYFSCNYVVAQTFASAFRLNATGQLTEKQFTPVNINKMGRVNKKKVKKCACTSSA